MARGWILSIQHADAADWITVVGYMTAAALALRASTTAHVRNASRDLFFWRLTAVVLVFLGVNELMDFQTLLTQLGRSHAKENGWYGQHRRLQYVFVVACTLAATLAAAAAGWLTRRAPMAVRVALVGLILITLFILLRAASFHHLDELLGKKTLLFEYGFLQEAAGIVIVAGAAYFYKGGPGNRGKRH